MTEPVEKIKSLRILLADDHALVRRGLRELITSHPNWELCAEAKTGREAIDLHTQHKPDIVVLDISMPDLNGLEAARRIHESSPNTRILILTLHFSNEMVRDIVGAGARGYITKSDADCDLISAIEALAGGRTFFTARAADMLLDNFSGGSLPDTGIKLTSREREIVQLLAEGKSSKEVAAALGISRATAEVHRSNIYKKLNFHSVSEVVRYAVKNQMIECCCLFE